jgi:hypothetical protein
MRPSRILPGVSRRHAECPRRPSIDLSLGLPLDQFIAVAITGIQQVAPEIDL